MKATVMLPSFPSNEEFITAFKAVKGILKVRAKPRDIAHAPPLDGPQAAISKVYEGASLSDLLTKIPKPSLRAYAKSVVSDIPEDAARSWILWFILCCVDGDTLVTTIDRNVVPIRNLRPGDLVLAFRKRKFVASRVVSVTQSDARSEDVYHISFANSEVVIAT